MKKFLISLLLFCLLGGLARAQLAYRIEADIFTKTRLADSTFQISKGKLFYDKNIKKSSSILPFPNGKKSFCSIR